MKRAESRGERTGGPRSKKNKKEETYSIDPPRTNSRIVGRGIQKNVENTNPNHESRYPQGGHQENRIFRGKKEKNYQRRVGEELNAQRFQEKTKMACYKEKIPKRKRGRRVESAANSGKKEWENG